MVKGILHDFLCFFSSFPAVSYATERPLPAPPSDSICLLRAETTYFFSGVRLRRELSDSLLMAGRSGSQPFNISIKVGKLQEHRRESPADLAVWETRKRLEAPTMSATLSSRSKSHELGKAVSFISIAQISFPKSSTRSNSNWSLVLK